MFIKENEKNTKNGYEKIKNWYLSKKPNQL